MPHSRLLGGVDGGAVPGHDRVVLALARGDQDQHVHTGEAPDEGAAIVEVDAADGQCGREVLGIARPENGGVTVSQPLGNQRAQGTGSSGNHDHQGSQRRRISA